jgi:D-alanyl-D-alanine dipeptidase
MIALYFIHLPLLGLRSNMKILIILMALTASLFADSVDVKTMSGKTRKLYVVKDNKLVLLVDILDYIPDAIVDMKYSTEDSMFKKPVYSVNKCFVKKELAEKLKKANDILKKKYKKRIKFWDCYRPWSVQKTMWELYPKKGYVAHPAYGSNHNRGCAIDITLTDLEGRYIEMPTKFDDLSKKANHNYQDLPKEVIKNRFILKSVMRKVGLNSIRSEWWHYNLPNPKRYPVIDIELSNINKK